MMRLTERPKPAQRVQRKAAGSGTRVASAPKLDGGRPLDGAVRGRMESGFGQDLSQVRVHDGPAAAQAARSADALAYTAGNDIVFGAGQYSPSTEGGSALLAHEVAHTIQQGGVQYRAAGAPAAGTDMGLEAEADRAAAAVVAGERVGPLTRMAAPAMLRAKQQGAAGGASKKAGGPQPTLPRGMTLISETPEGAGATQIEVRSSGFTLPKPKGQGEWVKNAYKNAGDGGRLVFTTDNAHDSVAAWKEEGSSGEYQRVWLSNLGFTSMKALGEAIRTSTDKDVKKAMKDPAVAAAVAGMESDGLKGSGFDVDHIVEKQIGGTSVPTNLQLLVAAKNQESGGQTYETIKAMIGEVRKKEYRPNATRIQIRFARITPPTDPVADASFKIETFLRAGKVAGNKELIADTQATPVTISAGGMSETVRIGPDETKLEIAGRRIVPGMRLKTYRRAKGKKAGGQDVVDAVLDSGAVQELPKEKAVPLVSSPDTSKVKPTGVGGLAASEAQAAVEEGERRVLNWGKPKPKELPFYYPYLSPGALTSFDLGADGYVTGSGYIAPTLRFLPKRIDIRFGRDQLELVAPLDVKKFRSLPFLRFTEGALGLQLAPQFVPSGTLKFELGPAGKPLILGQLDAGLKNGKFAAAGKLMPAMTLPGIKDARGDFAFDQDAGWSGSLTATSSKIPGAEVNVVVGFSQQGDEILPTASGGIVAKLRDKRLELNARYEKGRGLVYSGGVSIPKPFPIVDSVDLDGVYAAGLLDLTGKTKVQFRSWQGDLTLRYQRKDGEEGKFSGHGKVAVKTKNKKAKGSVDVDIDDAGQLTGTGKLLYQLTDKIAPELTVTLSKGGHLKIAGAVTISDVELFGKLASAEKTLVKASPSFPIPIPPLEAVVNIRAAVGIAYGIGPGKLASLTLSGEFDPLEDNPNIKASLKGRFVINSYFDLTGSVSASLGIQAAGGAIGADVGVRVTPSVGVSADAVATVDANYEKGGFDIAGKAFIDVAPHAHLGIDLVGSIYALWHAVEYQMTYPVKSYDWTFPQKIKVNLGEIGYSSATGQMRWPKLSDISVEPAEISPLAMMRDVMGRAKAKEKS